MNWATGTTGFEMVTEMPEGRHERVLDLLRTLVFLAEEGEIRLDASELDFEQLMPTWSLPRDDYATLRNRLRPDPFTEMRGRLKIDLSLRDSAAAALLTRTQ